MHLELEDDLVRRIDAVAGPRGRSRFVREAVVVALDQRQRAELIRSARGAIDAEGHDWDQDPAKWVQGQRRAERRRLG
jgi:predicted transcriptional regulator